MIFIKIYLLIGCLIQLGYYLIMHLLCGLNFKTSILSLIIIIFNVIINIVLWPLWIFCFIRLCTGKMSDKHKKNMDVVDSILFEDKES